VRTEVVDGLLRVIVAADGAPEYKVFTLTGPSRIVVDIAGVRSAFGSKTIHIGRAHVDRVRAGEPGGGILRLVIDINAMVGYQVMRDGASLIILVGDTRELNQSGLSTSVPVKTHQ
jgi:hypothetical protein